MFERSGSTVTAHSCKLGVHYATARAVNGRRGHSVAQRKTDRSTQHLLRSMSLFHFEPNSICCFRQCQYPAAWRPDPHDGGTPVKHGGADDHQHHNGDRPTEFRTPFFSRGRFGAGDCHLTISSQCRRLHPDRGRLGRRRLGFIRDAPLGIATRAADLPISRQSRRRHLILGGTVRAGNAHRVPVSADSAHVGSAALSRKGDSSLQNSKCATKRVNNPHGTIPDSRRIVLPDRQT